jgi:acetolactate synthase-1/3 small subunit
LVYQEIALYKLATDKVLSLGGIEPLIRKYNARVLEILDNCVVLEKTGLYEETQEMFNELASSIGVLQFIRSGRVAITRGRIERLSDMLASIEKRRQEEQL